MSLFIISLFCCYSDCDLFTKEAANAFLKTLEEPANSIVFFLQLANFQVFYPP